MTDGDDGRPFPVLMVWPPVKGGRVHGFLPLGLGYLAANLPSGWEARLWDAVLAPQPADALVAEVERLQPRVVAISVWDFNVVGAREVVRVVRERFPRLPIVVGGPAASGHGAGIFDVLDVDYAVAGEGERPFRQLLEAMGADALTAEAKAAIPGLIWRDESGRVVANPPTWEALDGLAHCDYEFIRFGEYLRLGYRYGMHSRAKRTAPLHTTRGCPYPCEYCSARLINGTRVRCRPIPDVLAEIRELRDRFQVDGFNILDDNFTFHGDYAKDLCRAILTLDLRGVSFCAPNGVKVECLDEELLGLMKRVGFEAVFIAPESGSERTLQRMRKRIDLQVVKEKLALIRWAGLKTFGFFIIGYPDETVADIRQTIAFACRNPFDAVVFTCFQPLAGTPVAAKLIASGEIEGVPEGVDYYEVTYAPRGLTVRQMKRWRLWGLARFYTSSWRRLRTAFANYSLKRIAAFVLKLR